MIQYGGVDLGREEYEAIRDAVLNNWWGLAKEGKKFEKELAKVGGTKHAIFVSSGSAALELGIAASKLPEGSEVIVPATTFPTPIASLLRANLVPVVVDVGDDLQIDPEAIERAVTKNTKAILIVNVAGNIGDYGAYQKIADDNNIELFIDDCDGFGGTWEGKMTISFGSFSAISTHAAHIIATGQGGVLFTDDDVLARSVREMRDWGRTINYESGGEPNMPKEYQRYTYTEIGYNFQPLELQAAMGRVQLKKLNQYKEKRAKNFKYLYNNLPDSVGRVKVHGLADPCWHTFPILVEDRPALIDRLNKAKIEWRPILAGNIARQPAYKNKVIVRGKLTKADEVFEKGIWLPVHPMHGEKEMSKIVECII